MPPFTFPSGYCQGIQSGASDWISRPTRLDGDFAFCLSWSHHLWLGFLFVSVAAWPFLTLLELFGSFNWRGLAGFETSELLRKLARPLGYLLAACASFFLLLLVHQAIYLILDLFFQNQEYAGGAPTWHIDLFWDRTYARDLTDVETFIGQHTGSVPDGGTLNDLNGPFGLTWTQIQSLLVSLSLWLPNALKALRFATFFVVLVTAPVAILSRMSPFTSALFDLWARYWMQLEGIVLGSIAALACYQALDLSQLDAVTAVYVRLGLLGLVSVANLGFLTLVLANFLREGATYYAAEKQRSNASTQGWIGVGALALGAVVVGVATGGFGLPLVAGLAAGGAAASAAGGIGGALATWNQAQNTPYGQVGPGAAINQGLTRGGMALAYGAGALEEGTGSGGTGGDFPGWEQRAGGGLSVPPQTYQQQLSSLGEHLGTQLAPPGALTSFDATGGSRAANLGAVSPAQAMAAYLPALAARGGRGSDALQPWAPPGSGAALTPHLRVGNQMVPVDQLEARLRVSAPYLKEALNVQQQAGLRVQDFPGVLDALRNYHGRSTGGRWGLGSLTGYRPARVEAAVRRATRVGAPALRLGLLSRDRYAQRIVQAIEAL